MENNVNKNDWSKFVLENKGSFLQSCEWGEFQESLGRRVFRFADFGGPVLSGVEGWAAQFVEYPIPYTKKKYWYCARGPVLDNSKCKSQNAKLQFKIQNLIEDIKKIAGKDIVFFRIGPEWEDGVSYCHSGLDPESSDSGSRIKCGMTKFKGLGFKKLHYENEPTQTLILDLNKSEEELLAGMHEKWRYNIRLAERKGVKIKIVDAQDSDFGKYFDDFYELMQMTCKRQGIRANVKEYYKKQLTINNQQLKFKLFVAEYENKVIAANVVVMFGRTATYLHGASDNEFRALMAPHLLQWEQIKEAKKQGCEEYDFWGFGSKKYPGVTNFKRGFGGREVKYVGCFDYPLDKKWYYLYRLVQTVRR